MQALRLPTVGLAPSNPHLEQLGGPGAVVRLVDAFYAAMDTRPDARQIRAMHGPDLSPVRAVLVDYLIEWLGGEKLYTQKHGPPRLGRIHQRFRIDADARQAWMACMQQALDEVCGDEPLRQALTRAFDKLATHLQNQPTTAPGSDTYRRATPFTDTPSTTGETR